jgi:hypothetical protein
MKNRYYKVGDLVTVADDRLRWNSAIGLITNITDSEWKGHQSIQAVFVEGRELRVLKTQLWHPDEEG